MRFVEKFWLNCFDWRLVVFCCCFLKGDRWGEKGRKSSPNMSVRRTIWFYAVVYEIERDGFGCFV